MPDLNELASLIDVSADNPALSAGHPFINVSNGIYWSSTSYFGGAGGSPQAWTIRLGDGRYMNDSRANVKSNRLQQRVGRQGRGWRHGALAVHRNVCVLRRGR